MAEKQGLVVLRKKMEPNQIEVLRGQVNHVNQTLKRKSSNSKVKKNKDTIIN